MTRDPLLSLENVTKHFVVRRSLLGVPLQVVRAVDGISFEVAGAETLALAARELMGISLCVLGPEPDDAKQLGNALAAGTSR